MARQKALAASLLTIVLVAVGLGSPALSSASVDEPLHLYAELSGTYSFKETLVNANPAGTLQNNVVLNWDVDLNGEAGLIKVGVILPKITIKGTVTQAGTGAESPVQCSGNLSAASHMSEGDRFRLLDLYPPGDPSIPQNASIHERKNQRHDYLLEGSLPGIANANDVVSSDTNPSDSGCNTGGLTFYQPPPQGSSQYTSWTHFSSPYAFYGSREKRIPHVESYDVPFKPDRSPTSFSFNWSGPVSNAPPGTTITVTEQGSDEFRLEDRTPF